MLEVAFKNSQEGVYIQTRHNAYLFIMSHFKTKTRTAMHLVWELLFADDSALVAHSASEMQSLVASFARIAELFSLETNIRKTECPFQPVPPTNNQPEPIMINGQQLAQTTEFTYLGSIISDNARLDKELRNRMGKASTSFGKLQDRLWKNNHMSLRAKGKVHIVIVLSSLLCGAKTWTLHRSQVKKLHSFMMGHLRDILNVSWKDKIQDSEILRRVNLPKMEDNLVEKNLMWLGHVKRMSSDHLPCQLLYSQLTLGRRGLRRLRLRFKDVAKRNMKLKKIILNSWKQSACDGAAYRRLIRS